MYVPYDPSSWQTFWNAIMTTIGSTTKVGFVIFGAIFCVNVFRAILRHFF